MLELPTDDFIIVNKVFKHATEQSASIKWNHQLLQIHESRSFVSKDTYVPVSFCKNTCYFKKALMITLIHLYPVEMCQYDYTSKLALHINTSQVKRSESIKVGDR